MTKEEQKLFYLERNLYSGTGSNATYALLTVEEISPNEFEVEYGSNCSGTEETVIINNKEEALKVSEELLSLYGSHLSEMSEPPEDILLRGGTFEGYIRHEKAKKIKKRLLEAGVEEITA